MAENREVLSRAPMKMTLNARIKVVLDFRKWRGSLRNHTCRLRLLEVMEQRRFRVLLLCGDGETDWQLSSVCFVTQRPLRYP